MTVAISTQLQTDSFSSYEGLVYMNGIRYNYRASVSRKLNGDVLEYKVEIVFLTCVKGEKEIAVRAPKANQRDNQYSKSIEFLDKYLKKSRSSIYKDMPRQSLLEDVYNMLAVKLKL